MARIYDLCSRRSRNNSHWRTSSGRGRKRNTRSWRPFQVLKDGFGLIALALVAGWAAAHYSVVPTDRISGLFSAPRSESQPHIARYFPICGSGKRVNCIVDGDTLYVNGEKIRVTGFNTPELFSPECAYEKKLARRAQRRFQQLVNSGPFDLRRTSLRDEDVYGRKLRSLYRDGKPIGDQLIAEGLAHRWRGFKESWCS
ncbi:thermonuclease family protein [Nitratireductor kimnyeongensis]|uniref:Thermonuclease family protein n=1 Tax=Nitratireductor kimnyeongensis TaxID=430679 RepID=A0ABW0T8S7_9HYPH|nr:thermonuclease family protein [Nitratireductor kimnyeongensis]QZZ35824.1 thermonuclease family protein [Nitratireductor kimnyeongensis]